MMKKLNTRRWAPLALTLSISPALHAQQLPEPQADTPPQAVEVVGRRSGGAYYATDASGTKTPFSLRELPQAVRIMSRQSLDDLGAVRMDDALDYVGGVSRQNSFGGLWDNVAIRGLAGDINNGMALLHNGFSANRGFNAARDSANIERLEFLKGAAASLYGASEPGGTINVVSKSPVWRRALSAEMYAGSGDFQRAAFDATGPLGEAAAYRLNAAAERRGGLRDHVRSRRALLAPAFAWKLSPSTRFDYKGEFLRNRAPLDRGVVAVDGNLAAIARERFLGEPADGDIKIANDSHQLVLEHALSDAWSARFGLAYKQGSWDGFSTEPQPALQADGRTLRRQRRYRDFQSDDLTTQTELTGRFHTGRVSHHMLAGIETVRFNQDLRMLRVNPSAAAPYAIDVLAPVYGQAQPVPLPNTDTHEEQRNASLYLQDAMSFGNWRVLAGVRRDHHDQTLRNNRTALSTTQRPSASAPRMAVSYLVDTQWTLFANAGKSFRPNNGVDALASPFAPERGEAMEIGAKWENEAHSLGATFALYQIVKRNVLTSDPGNSGFSIAAGKVRSRGMDLDLSGQLNRAWRINASLSYIDATVMRDNLLAVGDRLLNVPRVNASTLLVYEGVLDDGRKFGIGGGITGTGQRLGEVRTQAQAAGGAPAFMLPGYAIGKLVAYWQVSPRTRLSLDVDNVLDKTYYTNSFQRTWVSPGTPRTATLGLQAKF